MFYWFFFPSIYQSSEHLHGKSVTQNTSIWHLAWLWSSLRLAFVELLTVTLIHRQSSASSTERVKEQLLSLAYLSSVKSHFHCAFSLSVCFYQCACLWVCMCTFEEKKKKKKARLSPDKQSEAASLMLMSHLAHSSLHLHSLSSCNRCNSRSELSPTNGPCLPHWLFLWASTHTHGGTRHHSW